MSIEDNKALMRRYVEEILSKGNAAVAADFISDPAFVAWLGPWLAKIHRAFPDFQATLEDMIAEGDEVAIRVTMRGTHTGVMERGTFSRGIPEDWDLPDLPPTGKALVWRMNAIYHIVDGRWDVHWGTFNTLSILDQLGAIPHLVPVTR